MSLILSAAYRQMWGNSRTTPEPEPSQHNDYASIRRKPRSSLFRAVQLAATRVNVGAELGSHGYVNISRLQNADERIDA